MQKEELISLANEMCKELLTIINEEENATKEQVANFLNESAQIMKKVTDKDVNSIGLAGSIFHNAYKDIAKKSLSSYADTNENIKKLTKMHEETLEECGHQHIDLANITNKFNEIQSHMNDEVQKANETILQLTSQVKTLEEKSNLDSLTKVFNRRALSDYLDKLCGNTKSTKDMHILMLDIDDFKNVNDQFGHIAGDKILIFIANILKKTLRDGDKIFRYGGEEFIIILNRINNTRCQQITNRILTLVRESKLIYKGITLQVTTSIGTTKFAKDDTPDSLLARADKALYVAKNSGKNQIYTEVI